MHQKWGEYMRKIKWFHLILFSGGIISGWLFKSLLIKNNYSDWWIIAFITVVCLAFIEIDLKQDSKGEA